MRSRILIPTITMVIIASQLFGCSCSTQDETLEMINRGEQIELEIAEPDFEIKGEDTEITWAQLADLVTYPKFRTAFENAFEIVTSNGIKEGVVYVDLEGNQTNNSTLYNAFMNSQFTEKWKNGTIQSQLNDGISTTYADLEESDYMAAIINAYFNLLDDNQPNYFNGGSSLTRGEAMTMLMRATTPVEDLKSSDTFKSLVGNSEYTEYASYMDSNAFINSSDKSISEQNFKGAMTRAEFVYMVMNQTFGKDVVSNFDSSKVSMNDCKNAGNIASTKKFEGKDYCNSYVINEMVKNPDSGVTESIYKALAMAKEYGVISSETRWDEVITKTEGIDIIIASFEAKTKLDGHKTEVETGKTNKEAYIKEAEEKYEKNKSSLDCSKEEFVDLYISIRLTGGTTEEALSKCVVNFEKEEPTTEQPTTSHKELETYIDENGVPQFKLETPTTKENATYKYAEDINGIDDAIAHLKTLGYKLGDHTTLTEEQVRAVYKDFSKSLSKEDFEMYLSIDKNVALVAVAMASLPSNPNAPTTTTTEKTTTSSHESDYFVEDSYVKPTQKVETEEEQTTTKYDSISDIFEENPDVPDDIFDNLTPDDNIFY